MLRYFLDDFKNLYKDKLYFTILFLIPIMVNFLLGFVLCENQISHVPTAILNEDNSYFSRMLVQQFCDNDVFKVDYYPQSRDEMNDLLSKSKARVGLIIPKDFYKEVTKMSSPTVLMLYDGSNMSMVSVTKAKANEILLSLKTGVSMKLMQGKLNLPSDVSQKIALAVSFTTRTLYNPSKSFKYFLNPGLSAAIVQSAIVLLGALAIRREELPKGKGKKMLYFLSKALNYSIAGTLSIIIGILIQWQVFGVPFKGKLLYALLLSIPFTLSVSLFSMTTSLIFNEKMLPMIMNAILFVPSTVLVGYTWPVISMPLLYRLFAGIHPFYHYADNLRDIYLKGSGFASFASDMFWLTKFSLLFVLISGILMYFYDKKYSDKISMNESGSYEITL